MRPQTKRELGAVAVILSVILGYCGVAQEVVPLPPGGPPGDGPRRGDARMMVGGPMGGERKLVKQFDKDADKRLNAAERKAALEFLKSEPARGRGPGGMRGPGPGFGRPGEGGEAPKPGPAMSPTDVKNYPDAALYEPTVLRTFFLEFEGSDWEKELMAFNNTDVEVPATLTVDGQIYRDVGVHIRGMSSSGVGEGRKHSLNVSVDFVHENQAVKGYRTLNLLNSHEDPSFLRTVLYAHIANQYLPTPKANLVRVVINGESWGVFANAQQFNKDFTRDKFKSTKGARWKAPGSPGGRANLAYLGDDPAAYKQAYDMKSKDDPKAWADLLRLTKVLNQTPPEQLEAALAPLLDIDGALKFLALENALINNDGYWIRTSDYNLYQDERGRFHIVPHDMNETFARPGGPGFGMGGPRRMGPGGTRGPGAPGGPDGPPPGDFLVRPDGAPVPARRGPGGVEQDVFLPPGGGPPGPGFGPGGPGGPGGNMPRVEGVKLDPLVAAQDERKPLLSKLLAVPALRDRYLGYVRDIAQNWLDWSKLGPLAEGYHQLIAEDVRVDTRKLDSYEAFEASLKPAAAVAPGADAGAGGGVGAPPGPGPGRGPGRAISLRVFADERRAYLLAHPEVKRVAR